MNIVKAKIYWIPEQDGGRKNIPSNHNYSTLVHFDDIEEEYPLGAWSVVIDLEKAQILNCSTNLSLKCKPLSIQIIEMLKKGGIVPLLKE